jgi:hypothetical protein
MSLYDGRHPEDVRMPAAFYLPYLGPARHAHFSIMGWVADLFDDARVCGTTVSTDLHDWDGVNPYHKVFALRADLVFLSTAALGERKDTVMRAIVEQGRALAVIAMAGADGAYLLERGSDEVRHFPARNWTCPWWTRMARATRLWPPSCTPGWQARASTPPCAAAPLPARLPAPSMARMNASSGAKSCMTYIKMAQAYDLKFYQA